MKTITRILSIIIVLALLAGCAPAPTPAPTATATNTPAPTATALPIEPEPLLPPYLRPGSEYSPIAVQPPDMSSIPAYTIASGSVVDEYGASAYYAAFRADPKRGPQPLTDTNDFISTMDEYAKANPEIKLFQVEGEEIVYSMLVNKFGHVFLMFDDSENAANGIGYGVGALTFSDTGYWKDKATGVWINPGLKNGESLSLVPGEDGHGYVVKLDVDGNIIAYLNTFGATRDNIYQQWIRVMDGKPESVWDGQKMVYVGPINNPEMLDYLKGFEKYEVSEVDRVRFVTVTHNGENYIVYKDEGGKWVRNYDDMAKLALPGGKFDWETAGNVFTFGVEVSEDGKEITINKDDYLRYKETVANIFNGLDPAGLAFLEVIDSTSDNGYNLIQDVELLLSIQKGGHLPQVIGRSRCGKINIVTLATDKGPVSLVVVEGEIEDFGERDREGDGVSSMSTIASSGPETKANVYLQGLMTSEAALKQSKYYTIKDREALGLIQALARGFEMSFEDFERITRPSSEWVTREQFMVAKKLIELDQPLPVHDVFTNFH